MMKNFVLTGVLILLLSGCSKYNFSRAVYEGVQTNNQLNATPVEQISNPQMNYDQYEAERKR
jgi:PBP1b-binding outer membrane lipoprotein LpoB